MHRQRRPINPEKTHATRTSVTVRRKHLLRTLDSPDHTASEQGFRRIAGVDEAGRGPWAGPVVAAAVVLQSMSLSVRIDDSKRLSPRQRATAFEYLIEHAQCGVGIVSAQEIDNRNILQATFLAMQKAINELVSPPDLILVDGNLPVPGDIPCWPIVRGDSKSLSIASASIIAKVVRDEIMEFYDDLFPEYFFKRHKGYGTPEHSNTLGRFGPSLLHRFSFAPVRAAKRVQDAEGHDVAVAGVLSHA